MSEEAYALIKGIVKNTQSAVTDNGAHKHYKISVLAKEQLYTAAVNVYSYQSPNGLLYYHSSQHTSYLSKKVSLLEDGLHQNLGVGTDSLAIDYLRTGLLNVMEMITLSPTESEDDSSVIESMLDDICQRAILDNRIRICIWGQSYPSGIHDVHMNQGNSNSKDNAIWQDGAILFVDSSKSYALDALFLAFQTQCFNTDDHGNCVDIPR